MLYKTARSNAGRFFVPAINECGILSLDYVRQDF